MEGCGRELIQQMKREAVWGWCFIENMTSFHILRRELSSFFFLFFNLLFSLINVLLWCDILSELIQWGWNYSSFPSYQEHRSISLLHSIFFQSKSLPGSLFSWVSAMWMCVWWKVKWDQKACSTFCATPARIRCCFSFSLWTVNECYTEWRKSQAYSLLSDRTSEREHPFLCYDPKRWILTCSHIASTSPRSTVTPVLRSLSISSGRFVPCPAVPRGCSEMSRGILIEWFWWTQWDWWLIFAFHFVAGKAVVTGSGNAVHEIKVNNYEAFVLSFFLLGWCFLRMPCGATSLTLLQWKSLEERV